MEKIDFNKTISNGRVIYKNKLLMRLNIISFALLIAFIEFILALAILKQDLFEWNIVWLFVAITSIGFSILKWNYTMRIRKIITEKSKSENRNIIERFINEKGFQYRYHNNGFIQTISKYGFLWLTMELNFIILENAIYINLNYSNSRINWPSFFLIIKYIKEIEK